MSRYTTHTLALAVGLTTMAGGAYAQTLDAANAQPQTFAATPELVASRNSQLIVDEATPFADGATVTATVDLLDDQGAVIPATTIDVSSATTPTAFTNSTDTFTVVLGGVGVLGLTINNTPNAAGIRLTIGDGSNTDAVDYTLDEGAPALVQAILDDETGSESLFLIFDRSLTNMVGAPGANDPNQTTNADITSIDDFEIAPDSAFTTPTPLDGSIVSAPTILATGNVIQYTLNAPSAIGFGDFVRPVAGSEISGVNGETALTTAQAFSMETALAVDSVEFVKSLGDDGDDNEAVRVTFNQSLGDAGPAAFYSDGGTATWTLGGAPSAVTVNAVNIDPNDSQSVLLDIDLDAGAQIDADGLDDTGDAFGVTFDSDPTPANNPTTVLGTAFAGTTGALTVGDGIEPTLGVFGFVDTNGDGALDGVAMTFNEPMGAPGTATTVLNAFDFETVNTMVHPFSLFQTNLANGVTDPNDAVNEAEIAADGVSAFNASGFAVQSEDSANRLMTNNIVVAQFDPAAVDFNGDGTVDAADADLFPGTFDTGWATLAVTAADADLADANGNAVSTDLAAAAVNNDFAEPLLVEVWHRSGENDFDDQFWFEQGFGFGSLNDDVGDNAADTAILIFNENMAGAPDTSAFSFGPSASERFEGGDFEGIGDGPFANNAVLFRDFDDNGWDIGDTLTIGSANNLTDAATNDFTGGNGEGLDRNSPFLPVQFDINGNGVHAAFVNPAADDSVESISLIFNKPVEFVADDGTPVADLSTVAPDFTVDGTPVASVAVSGNVVTLTPAGAGNLLASSSFTIEFTPAADRNLAEAGLPVNQVDTGGTITAQPIAEAEIDGEFPAVMDVFGAITRNGAPAPAGTQVFGMLAVQRIGSITASMDGVDAVIDDESSLEAFTDFILGLENQLFLIDDGGNGNMFFTYNKDDFNGSGAILTVQARITRGVVSWTARGSSTVRSNASARGDAQLVWDVLRSSDGTAYGLVNNGFEIGGTPISSKAVVTENDGSYLLHVTGPRRVFNGSALGATGAAVILVVEQTNGERLMASSIHNGADLLGTLQFNPLQNQEDPANGRFDGAVDIELNNIGHVSIYEGWNLVGFNRDSGFALSSQGLPASVPAGITVGQNSNIITGTTLTNAPAYLQWGFFVDANGDGVWTRNDDNSFSGGLLSTVLVDPRGFDEFFAFTLTDRGVQANNNISGLVGGFGMGAFYGGVSANALGAFQFGPERAAGTALFGSDGFASGRTNLGWGLVTAAGDDADAGAFLSANSADFLIEFNRTSDSAVNITTFTTGGPQGDPAGDTSSVNRGQAYFFHFPN